jgi:hypothetical protein
MALTTLRVGGLRPSQLLYVHGPGAFADLPRMSVVVMGLDDWDVRFTETVAEPRLLAAVRAKLGSQVSALRTPPYLPEATTSQLEADRVGVPVGVFPRWMRCSNPACRRLAPVDQGLFELKEHPFRAERVGFEHTGCARRPVTVLPARFLLACRRGHLDDFPWVEFAHKGAPCARPLLRLEEQGVTGEAADVWVRCEACGAAQSMAQAFGDEAKKRLPACRGRHPHLQSFQPCEERTRTILLGATNSWFPVTLSVLSVPGEKAELPQALERVWAKVEWIAGPDVLGPVIATNPDLTALRRFEVADVWAAMEARRSGLTEAAAGDDLLGPEWDAFADPEHAPRGEDFQLRAVPPPRRFADRIESVVLGERLREVGALIQFSRIDAPEEGHVVEEQSFEPAPLSRSDPLWVPCTETRGEGIFLRLREDALHSWERRVRGTALEDRFLRAHAAWRQRRHRDPRAGWPGLRYILLHTLAHALIREVALECGYGAADIRERIYASSPDRRGGPMAGVLLYTAASDSEGTLGGLVSLGEPEMLERLLAQALETARLCSSDPLCAEHDPRGDNSLHCAACHACLFAAETSCERGNTYLDRAVLVETLTESGAAFFDGP